MNNAPEAKLVTYLSTNEVGEDIHIVKETHFENNRYTDNIKIIKDYKRPFHITKPIFRNHTDKKEAEDISRVDKYLSTESELFNNISRRVGNGYTGKADVRKLKKNPYIYSADVNSRTFLKQEYMTRNNNKLSPYRIGVFDIEFNVLTSEIIILTIVTKKKMKTALLKSFADTVPDLERRINNMFVKHIPTDKYRNMDRDIQIFDNEVDMIKFIFYEANYMDIDILTAWNIKYDITQILDVLERENEDIASVFHYDKIPYKYRYFNFKEGNSVKKTEAGREIAINIEERWHTIKTTTNYQMLDAMASHRYVRAGGATVSGGYSLDNILEKEGVAKKLTFSSNQGFKGIEWHIDMVANKPAEYIIYNMWDCLSMLELDDKTKDLTVSVPLLLGMSHPDIFNSGPKRIVDSLTFFYEKRGKVLGVKDMTEENDKILGLGGWILTLQSFMSTDNGLSNIEEMRELITNIKTMVFDSDCLSSYPNDILSANVSKDTSHRELIAIAGILKSTFILQNINSMFGATNAIEYCQAMFKMPSLFKLLDEIKE